MAIGTVHENTFNLRNFLEKVKIWLMGSGSWAGRKEVSIKMVDLSKD